MTDRAESTTMASESEAREVEDRLQHDLDLGHHLEVIPDLISAVEDQPLRQRRWALLMLALYRAGRQIEALRTFERLRSLLENDYGLPPSFELEELERAILLQRAELDWTSPGAPN